MSTTIRKGDETINLHLTGRNVGDGQQLLSIWQADNR
jgi:hypothetical protein